MINWISIKNKMPPEKRLILAYSPADGSGLARMYNKREAYWVYKKINGDKTVRDMTHWIGVDAPVVAQES